MSRYDYDENERIINAVLKSQQDTLNSIDRIDSDAVDERIAASERLLAGLGYKLPPKNSGKENHRQALVAPSWDDISSSAVDEYGLECDLEELFSPEELAENSKIIAELNAEFNQVHKLDQIDIAICSTAGLISGAIDILLVGIPAKTGHGLEAGPLSNYIRDHFEKAFPSEEMEKLASNPISKVPYDAQDNRHTTVRVEGLSAYYHRLLSLGHDPFLGLLFGTLDILNGTMTTVDKQGNAAIQVMENYASRRESDIFAALAKQLRHFASDVNTSMGLPAPLMGLFNLIQAGSIGEYEQTVAEIVQGMYFEGYDFVHFCSMSIPVILSEVVVRIGYALKRIHEGVSIKQAIPLTANRSKNPKIGTMLFIAHATASAINAGKVYFSKNPMAVNYPQWIAFSKQLYLQAKWMLFEKPEMRHQYVINEIDDELELVFAKIEASFLLND